MQIIDILRNDQQFARPVRIETRKRPVRRIGRDRGKRTTALIVEVEHQPTIPQQRLWRADRLDAVILRRAVASRDLPIGRAVQRAKGRHAGLGGDACPGQDDDVPDIAGHAGLLTDPRDSRYR